VTVGGPRAAFEGLVEDYDRARPRYPDALFAALPPLAGARVVELGAGTGIATGGLLAGGADVLAADLGPRMLARLRDNLPSVPVCVTRAEALPLPAASVDLVCGAQMWHWVDPVVAAREAARVLRPGGALCLWWNEVDAAGRPWWEGQQARLEAANPAYERGYRHRDYVAELRGTGLFGRVERVELPWSRGLDLATYEAWLRSKSYVDAIPRPAYDEFLAAERESLAAAFPDGAVVEPFVTRLWIAHLR